MTHLGTTTPVHPALLKEWQERAKTAEARVAELERIIEEAWEMASAGVDVNTISVQLCRANIGPKP